MRTKQKLDPDAIYVAFEAFVGDQFVVRKGMRLRGDHEAVKAAPHLFVQDGAGDEAIAAARAAAFDRVVKMSEAESPPLPPPAIDPSTRLGDLLICVQGVISSSAGSVREGTIVRKGDPRAIAVPEAFRPLAEQI
jgi:hypothetical protein